MQALAAPNPTSLCHHCQEWTRFPARFSEYCRATSTNRPETRFTYCHSATEQLPASSCLYRSGFFGGVPIKCHSTSISDDTNLTKPDTTTCPASATVGRDGQLVGQPSREAEACRLHEPLLTHQAHPSHIVGFAAGAYTVQYLAGRCCSLVTVGQLTATDGEAGGPTASTCNPSKSLTVLTRKKRRTLTACTDAYRPVSCPQYERHQMNCPMQ